MGRQATTEKVDEVATKSIENILSTIRKRFGTEAINRIGDGAIKNIEVIPTGSLGLDIALGVGGVPRGRVIEVMGPESAGKTTLALHIIAEAQKLGGIAGFVDAEHALDLNYAKKLGVDTDNLLLSQPDNGEQALEIAEMLVEGGANIVVIDSVAALVPKAELEGDMGDSVVAETPIVIRRNKRDISIVSIASLYGGQKDFIGKRYVNRYHKLKELEVLTSSGWKQLKTVFLKKNVGNKPIVVTNVLNGISMTTKDHSLFIEGTPTTPDNLSVGNLVDMYKPECINTLSSLTENVAWLLGYFCAEGSIREAAKTVFTFCDTDKQNIELCKEKLLSSFTVYLSEYTTDNSGTNRKNLYHLYVSRDAVLASLLMQCIDVKTKEKRIPDIVLNSVKECKVAFLEGYKIGDGVINRELYSFSTSSFLMLAGISYLFECLDYKFVINSNHREDRGHKVEFNITQVEKNIKKPREITKFISIPAPEFLYDLETEDGTFVGGAGCIIHHNSHMGLQARLMSQACRKLTGIVSTSNCCVLFINQIRMKIGVMFGNPETTTGGNALKFYSSVRIDVRKIGELKLGEIKVGIRTKAKIIKNKVAPPFKEVEYSVYWGEGISKEEELIDIGVLKDVVERSGAWYSYKGNNLGQGKEASRVFLKEHPDIAKEIEQKIHSLNNIN